VDYEIVCPCFVMHVHIFLTYIFHANLIYPCPNRNLVITLTTQGYTAKYHAQIVTYAMFIIEHFIWQMIIYLIISWLIDWLIEGLQLRKGCVIWGRRKWRHSKDVGALLGFLNIMPLSVSDHILSRAHGKMEEIFVEVIWRGVTGVEEASVRWQELGGGDCWNRLDVLNNRLEKDELWVGKRTRVAFGKVRHRSGNGKIPRRGVFDLPEMLSFLRHRHSVLLLNNQIILKIVDDNAITSYSLIVNWKSVQVSMRPQHQRMVIT
jgi:hypothetical protein